MQNERRAGMLSARIGGCCVARGYVDGRHGVACRAAVEVRAMTETLCKSCSAKDAHLRSYPVTAFSRLWNSINGVDAWAANTVGVGHHVQARGWCRMIAALYVQTGGAYFGLPDVDPWDEKRDARKYVGPYPVVAHPPCSRWCRLAGLVEARWGHKRGDDGGCFESALHAVRTWGGVLEHPAYTDAFRAYGIPAPKPGGWQRTLCGGWVAHIEQGRYGHPAKKATWLYAYGIGEPPAIDCRDLRSRDSRSQVSWCGNHTSKFDKRPRVGKRAASATPPAFKDLLISIARQAVKHEL